MHTNGLSYASDAGAKTSYPVPPNSVGDRILLLDGAIRLVGEAVERVAQQTNTIAGIADSIYGPLPPQAETKGGLAPFTGRAGGLDSVIGALHTRLSELEGQIERIRGL